MKIYKVKHEHMQFILSNKRLKYIAIVSRYIDTFIIKERFKRGKRLIEKKNKRIIVLKEINILPFISKTGLATNIK